VAFHVKIPGFEYFPFLKKFVLMGQYQWTTPETEGKEIIVTRLYLDGDIVSWFLEDEQQTEKDASPEMLFYHFAKIERDLSSINNISTQLTIVVTILTSVIAFVLNPSGWLENMLIISGIGIIGFVIRKLTGRLLMKIIGVFAGIFFKKNI